MAANIELAVNGTLMRGLELNPNLLNAGATFVEETVTEPAYRIWSINDRHPAMVRVASGGVAVAVEVWSVPAEGIAAILLAEPTGALCSAFSANRFFARGSARSRASAAGALTSKVWRSSDSPCHFFRAKNCVPDAERRHSVGEFFCW
jgi:hypothetical protein